MAKTIFEALRDKIHYPLKKGFFENVLIERGLDGDDQYTQDVAKDKAYRGAVADCYVALVVSPNIVEGGVSIDQTYKENILKIANSIYLSIGEDPADIGDKPMVFIES
jgi:hypothetical protein